MRTKQAKEEILPPIKHLKIVYWPIEKLKAYERNPRKNDAAVERMCASIREFGFAVPVLARSSGEVVDGHLRLKAAKKLGMGEVPVIVCDGWTEAQVKAFRLMVNRSVTWAEWDMPQLAQEFSDLKAMGFDLSQTGFEGFEINSIGSADWSLWQKENGVTPQWSGMPDFSQEDLLAWQTVRIHFANATDREAFAALLNQPITDHTKYLWYPRQIETSRANIRYRTEEAVNPRYPIYVISKGRWDSNLTCKALDKMSVPYRLVIEPQEREQYAAVTEASNILALPFSNLGEGSIPARNWVWEHAISEGHARHWILDDNIRIFYRLNQNLKVPVTTGACFRAAEDFVDRYTNVALASLQYQWLAKQKQKIGPFVLNSRVYSCILIDNSVSYRWRGRYNEDTDLSLRALKDGFCTVEFNAFLADKQTTMSMKGGNTDELYKGDGRLEMAKSLQEQHPDVVKIVRKWGRWQHQVDYRPFKANKFIPKPGFEEPTEANNYGMVLEHV